LLQLLKEGEKIFQKTTFDAFLSTNIDEYLRTKNKKLLLFAGLVTSVCVLLNSATANQKGYLVKIIEDCCADFPEAHGIILKRYFGWMTEPISWKDISQNGSKWNNEIYLLEEFRSKYKIHAKI